MKRFVAFCRDCLKEPHVLQLLVIIVFLVIVMTWVKAFGQALKPFDEFVEEMREACTDHKCYVFREEKLWEMIQEAIKVGQKRGCRKGDA